MSDQPNKECLQKAIRFARETVLDNNIDYVVSPPPEVIAVDALIGDIAHDMYRDCVMQAASRTNIHELPRPGRNVVKQR